MAKKEIDEEGLKSRLNENPTGIYLFKGKEGLIKKNYVKKISDLTGGEGMSDFNLHRLDGAEVTLDDLADVCSAIPMMAPTKCVIVTDFDCKRERLSMREEELSFFMSEVPDYTALVFYYINDFPETKAPDYKALEENVSKYGCVVNFKPKDKSDITQIIEKGAKKRGRRFESGAAAYLRDNVSSDLTALSNEVDKLCAYCDEVITKKDIDTLCHISVEAKTFDMIKSLNSGRYGESEKILSQLFENREEPMMILGALISQYADMLRVKCLGNTPGYVNILKENYPATYKNANDYKFVKVSENAASCSLKSLSQCLEILSEADDKMKSSDVDKKLLLEKTLYRLYRARAVSKGHI